MNFNFYIERQIPFKEKGRDLNGVDCWGLVKIFYDRELGIDLPAYVCNYSDTKDAAIAEKIKQQRTIDWCGVGDKKSGDVILCRMRNRPMHVGIYKDGDFMLHIEEGNSVVLEKIKGLKWQKRILGIYRHKNLL